MFFCFYDHFWPVPLLAHTNIHPNRFVAPPFYSNRLVPKPLRIIFDPKELWPWRVLRDNLLFITCFWGHGPPYEGPPLPKTTFCGIPRCVVCRLLCCVVLCLKFSWVRPKLGRSPESLPPDSPSAGRTAQNFAFFFSLSLPPLFSFFLPLLGGRFVECGDV